ncbi:MAG: hypothetical protein U0797_18460 [Gemmataceae bacterium]
MAFSLFDYFQKQGLRVIETALKEVVGKAAVYVDQDDHYRQTVIQPAWSNLAPPVRLLLRKSHDHWCALFFEARDRVFNLRGGIVEQPDASLQLAALLRPVLPAQRPPAGGDPAAQRHRRRRAAVAGEGRHRRRHRPGDDLLTGGPPRRPGPAGVHPQQPWRRADAVSGAVRPRRGDRRQGGALSVSDPDKIAECVKRDMGSSVPQKDQRRGRSAR